ncbi:hypothetical protein BU24DRAFT_426571 [Aaosphaeria arxii CBS 175.79]|uniref:RNA-binding domain-containing protein n=1 Tax=Aaosphaeria arxii CBS 175.79 TaxID=1450172 RepID=A0A6A5XF93_9PLEO|nr:uncharacterized protein BU24DRAFT_426571 [Aaosphaeria arxii CBS 175.79]KAF2011487.1 hypothetical protein BU24DRAFT_426571 [Aaosphaeria arxii CBS 175.79]
MALPTLALPGQPLGPSSKYAPGPGTHIHESQIYASIAGPVTTQAPTPSTKPQSTSTTSAKPTSTPAQPSLPILSISRAPSSPHDILSTSSASSTVLPSVDSIVLCRVIRLGPRFASVEILAIDDVACRESFQGLIRREDVRATEKDKVRIEEAFRVGDIVRGVVISLGDQSNYYISTAENRFGVVLARSEAGNKMFPVSWKEFRDPRTGKSEVRKVAKPF